ncbi:hypothetical protein AAC387_Pa02g0845 [Persea americana]
MCRRVGVQGKKRKRRKGRWVALHVEIGVQTKKKRGCRGRSGRGGKERWVLLHVEMGVQAKKKRRRKKKVCMRVGVQRKKWKWKKVCRTDGDAGKMQGRERTWWVVDGDARGYC